MIQDKEVEKIGTMGRQSWHRLQGELQDVEHMVLRIDNILVPWRVSEWTSDLTQRYAGCEVYMLRRDMDDDYDEEDLTWEDLIGYRVFNQGEGEIGTVERVDESTMNVLLYLDNGRLIPAHEDLILSLDTEEKQLITDLPLGL